MISIDAPQKQGQHRIARLYSHRLLESQHRLGQPGRLCQGQRLVQVDTRRAWTQYLRLPKRFNGLVEMPLGRELLAAPKEPCSSEDTCQHKRACAAYLRSGAAVSVPPAQGWEITRRVSLHVP